MSKQERFLSLEDSYDGDSRYSLCIRSSQREYLVDTRVLKDLAQFLGFAEIKILSNTFLPPKSREIGEITSRVTDLQIDTLPPKAKWRKIELYLDIDKISQGLEEGFLEDERAQRVEELIKQELAKQGMKNLSEFSLEGLVFGDLIMYLVGLVISIIAMEKLELNQAAYIDYLFWSGILVKEILSAIDTLVHYQSTRYGARFTALESTQYLKTIILKNKLESSNILRLVPKKPRV